MASHQYKKLNLNSTFARMHNSNSRRGRKSSDTAICVQDEYNNSYNNGYYLTTPRDPKSANRYATLREEPALDESLDSVGLLRQITSPEDSPRRQHFNNTTTC